MKTYRKILLIIFIIYSADSAFAQITPTIAERIHQYLSVQQKLINFNGIVTVSKGNQIIRDTIGFASFEQQVPVRTLSGFRIASITKQFTAALTMKAVEEGKLHLSDTLSKFFPAAPNGWRRITIHQLLTHTSGIPHNEGIEDYWTKKSVLPLTGQQALDEIFNMRLLAMPGTRTQYSSPGYFVLATILELIYKENYADILTRKLFRPLALDQTNVFSPLKLIPSMTGAYHLLGDSLLVAPYRDYGLMKGSGDLYTNANDLLKWNNTFLTGNFWSKEVINRLFSVQNPASINGHEDPYGYGWFLRPQSASLPEAYYTGGGTFGCSAISVIYPKEKMSIIILSNVSTLPVNQLWMDIEKIIMGIPFNIPEVRKTIEIAQSELMLLPGRYVTASGQELNILVNGKQLYAKMGANPPFEIYSSSAFHYFGKKVAIDLIFKQDSDEKVIAIDVEGRGQKFSFTRKDP